MTSELYCRIRKLNLEFSQSIDAMKIIVVPSSSVKTRSSGKRVKKSITLNSTPLLALGTLLFTWIGASSYLLGYQLAQKTQHGVGSDSIVTGTNNSTSLKLENPELFNAWKKNLIEQNQQLQLTIKNKQQYLSKITQQVAELQSRQTRIEALAATLSKDANLDDVFDFSRPPAVGGLHDPSSNLNTAALPEQLAKLETDISQSADQLNRFASYFNKQKHPQYFAKSPPIEKGWLSSDYGIRRDPFSGRHAMHTGLDFAGKAGTNILAVADGTITFSGQRGGYGNVIEITHPQGLVTRYAHCKKLIAKVGDKVKAEQIIATMGSTGRSTGPHVHFEVLKNNKQVNPKQFFRHVLTTSKV
jgi:murein DD-endopeptidase MepM/ murein hydrolase activator NlpD